MRLGVLVKNYTLTAASMAATSILRIVIIASKARFAAARSAPVNASERTRGVICQ